MDDSPGCSFARIAASRHQLLDIIRVVGTVASSFVYCRPRESWLADCSVEHELRGFVDEKTAPIVVDEFVSRSSGLDFLFGIGRLLAVVVSKLMCTVGLLFEMEQIFLIYRGLYTYGFPGGWAPYRPDVLALKSAIYSFCSATNCCTDRFVAMY